MLQRIIAEDAQGRASQFIRDFSDLKVKEQYTAVVLPIDPPGFTEFLPYIIQHEEEAAAVTFAEVDLSAYARGRRLAVLGVNAFASTPGGSVTFYPDLDGSGSIGGNGRRLMYGTLAEESDNADTIYLVSMRDSTFHYSATPPGGGTFSLFVKLIAIL